MNRIVGAVTTARAIIGAAQEKLKTGPKESLSSANDKLTGTERNARSQNNTLGQTHGPEKVRAKVKELVEEGETPAVKRVLAEARTRP